MYILKAESISALKDPTGHSHGYSKARKDICGQIPTGHRYRYNKARKDGDISLSFQARLETSKAALRYPCPLQKEIRTCDLHYICRMKKLQDLSKTKCQIR